MLLSAAALMGLLLDVAAGETTVSGGDFGTPRGVLGRTGAALDTGSNSLTVFSTESAATAPATPLAGTATPPPCPLSIAKPAGIAVNGYGTSALGCIGAQGHDAKRQLAVSVPCGDAKLNVSVAAAHLSQLCNATPACVAFSIISPDYSGSRTSGQLLCELHPETISESSQSNQWWSVWQKTQAPKPGPWPYSPGQGPPKPPPPAKPIKPDLVWTVAPTGVTESMPIGNGRLGVNVWADSTDYLWLLLSHVDAIDENTNLDKLGRISIKAVPSTLGTSRSPLPQAFRQEMHLSNATISVDQANGVSIDVWVDATTDAIRVSSRGPAHKLQATLEVWRNETTGYPAGLVNGSVIYKPPLGCPSLHPNNTVVEKDDSILFYHRNQEEWVVPSWKIDLQSQQMPLDLPAVLVNQTFGGLLTGSDDSKLARTGPMQLTSAVASSTQSLSIAGTAGRYNDGLESFAAELAAAAAKPASRDAHQSVWTEFWNHSDITVKPAISPTDPATAAQADRVTFLDKVNRAAFHSMALGKHAIKFNAYGIFSAYPPPQEDYRVWGPCQWFQNIRLPYYHMLSDGRFEDMKSLFGFYFDMLPVSKARTSSWFNISGTFFPETKQQTGLYDSGGLGWGCKSASSTVPTPSNSYIRYHREGGLEISLMMVDWLEHTDDVGYWLSTLLPQIEAYVEYYAQHFKNNATSGKLDMFPAQALETWQCPSLGVGADARANCATNPMPQVAGLHALLPRLIALSANKTIVPDQALGAKWRALFKRVPDLPVGKCMQGPGGGASQFVSSRVDFCDPTVPSARLPGKSTCLLPAESLPPKNSNSENADLYAVHPFRVVGLYDQRELGITTYINRKFHGETGWSEDFMDAALLGLGNETAAAAIDHAMVAPFTGYRWVGFQAGIGAGGPITDHGGVATAGLRYMLLHSGVSIDGVAAKKIVLFPAWPCHDWAVDFKLHAPGRTVVQGSYDGAGTLSNFTVTPAERRADVIFADCVKTVV